MADKIQRVYADALFQVGSENNLLDAFFGELKELSKLLSQEPGFVKLICAPTVSNEEKSKVLSATFEGRLDTNIYNFIRILSDNGRFDKLPLIADEFFRMYNEHNNILEVTATTSIAMSDGLKQKLAARLSAVSGKRIVLTEKLDPAILGGIVLSYGNTRLDASVKNKLEKMKAQINSTIA